MLFRFSSLILVFLFGGATELSSQQLAQPNETQKAPSASINGFLLTIELGPEQKCTLAYRRVSQESSEEKKVGLNMDGPCEFVRMRMPQPVSRVLSYSYGKGRNKYSAVIVVGGKPDRSESDALMPGGCGIEIVAVSLFSDRLKTSEIVKLDSTICPSRGLDEKYFAIYARR